MDIPVGVDQTDHIAFFCPSCNEAMTVTKVQTVRVLVNADTGKHDKCTWIHLHCPSCKAGKGFRKFYWTVETGLYCDERTDSPNDKLSHAAGDRDVASGKNE